MQGETNLQALLQNLRPHLHAGHYVFCTVETPPAFRMDDLLFLFKEQEGLTIVLEKEKADALGLAYQYVSSWITLTVHSSLEAVGLTAAFSNALATAGISCNVVAAYYHDHIFVDTVHAARAMAVLERLAATVSPS